MILKASDSSIAATLVAAVRSEGGEIFMPQHIMEDSPDGWELHMDVDPTAYTITLRAVNTREVVA